MAETDARRIELETQRRRAERELAYGTMDLLLAGGAVLLAKIVSLLVGGSAAMALFALVTIGASPLAVRGLLRTAGGLTRRGHAMRELQALGVHALPGARLVDRSLEQRIDRTM